MNQIEKLQAKLDREAIDQLRDEVLRLNRELEETRQELYWAQQTAYDADRWQDLAIDLMRETGQELGMTRQGELGLIKQ